MIYRGQSDITGHIDPFSILFCSDPNITCVNFPWQSCIGNTPKQKPIIRPYCLYCEKEVNTICEKGACRKCHLENFCHGELKE